MFLRVRIIIVFVCFGIGVGIAPLPLCAAPPSLNKDLLSVFRSNNSTATKNAVTSNGASAISYHRLARNYAEQNDINKATSNFSLALQNAAPRQVAEIAADYAAFLTDIGDLHKAELMLRQALNQSPDDANLKKMLGQCLVRQEKTFEGLRYLKMIGTEAEAKAEIAAIYREQGNTEMLAVTEQNWGTSKRDTARPITVSPEVVRPEPALIVAVPRPAVSRPEPAQIIAAPTLSGMTRNLPPATVATTPKADVTPEKIAIIAKTPIISPLSSKSEFFDNRVPIPVPKVAVAPTPLVVASSTSKPVSVASAPTPLPLPRITERLVLTNPVELAVTSAPVLPRTEVAEPPRPAVMIQPRRHYVVNAGTADLEALLPVIKPVAATVSEQKIW